MGPNVTLQAAIGLVQAGDLARARAVLEHDAATGRPEPECARLLAKLQNALGDKQQAVATMRKALRAAPKLPLGRYELGVMLLECGETAEGIKAFRQALRDDPSHNPSRFNLAWALRKSERLSEAIEVYNDLVKDEPGNVDARFNLANLLFQTGKTAVAIEAYEQARSLAPNEIPILLNLGMAQQAAGRLDAAEATFAAALRLDSGRAEVLGALGNVLRAQGRFTEAVELLSQALERVPEEDAIACNLALALMDGGDCGRAQAVLERVVARGGGPAALNLLGAVHLRAGQPVEAERVLLRAVEYLPVMPDCLNNLGRAYSALGRLEDAIRAFRRAHDAAPEDASIHSNLLFALTHGETISKEQLFAEHCRFGQIQERLAGPPMDLPPVQPLNGRRLRVGYVSPDFREHAVTYLIEPLLAHHDNNKVEVFCYSAKAGADAVTHALKQGADHWRDIAYMPPDVAAALIRDDRIDILVDLAGHTANNALPVFARKPAPIQITWLGYPETTGLSRMDFRLGLGGPVPSAHAFSTEQVLNIPFNPPFREPLGAPMPVPPPMVSSGAVTFGAINKKLKTSAECIAAWSRIVTRLPSSRLVMVVDDDGDDHRHIKAEFVSHGVAAEALVLETRRPLDEFLELLNGIDICLDPFPYGGGTSTLFTCWMGVPTVTLEGGDQRQGSTSYVLRELSLGELVAADVDAYVETACALAGDPDRLTDLRADLRARMLLSPMMNGLAIAREVETVFARLYSMACAEAAA